MLHDFSADPPPLLRFRLDMQAHMTALSAAYPGVGLALFMFHNPAWEPSTRTLGRIRSHYISNSDRNLTLAAVREWTDRQEAAGFG